MVSSGTRALPLLMMYRMPGQSSPTPARSTGSRSPFVRLRELLGDTRLASRRSASRSASRSMPIPPFVGPVIAAHVDEFGRYPVNKGLDAFARPSRDGSIAASRSNGRSTPHRSAGAQRHARRTVSCGTRSQELGKPPRGPPAVLIPNPFYAAYAAGAIAAGCEPVYLPATKQTGFLPDLDAISEELLARTVAFYIASPPTRRVPLLIATIWSG